ncbi:MAG: hypothetical protein ABWZ77_01270 [Naasia sp.]
MTAQVHSRKVEGGEPTARRRKKVTAFALAGLVATAGIAGVVVTSSAYFTDVKEIGTNTVTLRGVDIDAFSNGTATQTFDQFNLNELAPLAGATPAEFATAPSQVFDLRNIGDSKFKYKVEVVDVVLKRKDGTTDLPTSDEATTVTNGALSAATIKNVVKVNVVRGTQGSTPGYTPTAGKTLTELTTTPEILPDSGTGSILEKKNASGIDDEATLGFRIWIEEDSLKTSGVAWTDAKKNQLQQLKITFKLKITATQITS